MPNQPKTKNRTFRISDELHGELLKVAAARGVSLSEVVRIALEKYLQDLVWEENH